METRADVIVSPAETALLGLPGPVAHGVLVGLAVLLFGYILWRRYLPLRLAAPDPRLDRIGARTLKTLIFGFGQARQPRYRVAGILHIVIFAGFLILSIRSLTLLGQGFSADFALPGLRGEAGGVYATLKDYTALAVLAACVAAILRRLLFRPARYHDRHAVRSHGHEAYLILGLISLLMIADAFFEGTSLHTNVSPSSLPLAAAAAALLSDQPGETMATVHVWSFWLHNVVLLGFLCYLPVSKHFHVITAIPNVFLLNLKPVGAVKPPRHDVDELDRLERLGVSRFEDFTWKHILDFYSCTDCGRCSDHCPAYATGTPLSPRMISVKSRDFAYEAYPIFGRAAEDGTRPIVGDVITDGELWACTTCGACEEACPVFIEYVDKIVDMRRGLVEEGQVPSSLQKPLADLEKRGNPYGKAARDRDKWTTLDGSTEPVVRTLAEGDAADTLVFTDSCAAYDPRIQKISHTLGRLMSVAGEDCGTLGKDEADSGHEVRRFGEEGLFEALRDQNLDAMESRSFERVVTPDPHALNALRNDGYDLDKPVLHHSQVLAELIRGGRLPLEEKADSRTYTFHDPCYLGRHNGEYDAPRDVLHALPGLKTVEMETSRNRSFCCGGGSLYLFHEGESESRMGEQRLAMAEAAGADVVVTACPFCMINLEDAAKTTGREDRMEIIDLAELVDRFVPDV